MKLFKCDHSNESFRADFFGVVLFVFQYFAKKKTFFHKPRSYHSYDVFQKKKFKLIRETPLRASWGIMEISVLECTLLRLSPFKT